jgi:hypothetical protein
LVIVAAEWVRVSELQEENASGRQLGTIKEPGEGGYRKDAWFGREDKLTG